MKRMLVAAAAATMVFAATAAQAQMKPDEVLKARQGLYQVIKMNFGPLGAMAKGEAPFNADTIVANVANMQAAGKLLGPTYAPQFKDLPNSNAKPEVWTDEAGRAEKGKAYGAELAKLGEIAKTASEADVKAQINAVGKACKACHDNYRKE